MDNTVLAEEQVDKHGRSWRSGAVVEKKLLKQWFIRTTRFAAEMHDALSEQQMENGWRDVAQMQRNWIGPPDGIRVEFRLTDASHAEYPDRDDFISSWTSKLVFSFHFRIDCSYPPLKHYLFS